MTRRLVMGNSQTEEEATMSSVNTPSTEAILRNAEATIHDLSRRRLLVGAGAAGALAGIAGLLPGRSADIAQASGPNDAMVNVKDYGAVGDGKTDDREPIMKAIEAGVAEGRTVFLPPGVYMLGSRLYMLHGLTMKGAGRFSTTLRLMPNCNGPILDAPPAPKLVGNDLTLMDITFDGDAQNSELTGASVALLHGYDTNRWYVARCRFMHGRGYGVGLQGRPTTNTGHEDLYFVDCEFVENHVYASGSGGIDTKSGKRFTMVNCVVIKEPVGFDIRSHFTTLINCHAYDCDFGFLIRAISNVPGSTDWEGTFTVLGGSVTNCIGTGLTIANSTEQANDAGITNATVIGFNSRNNGRGLATAEPDSWNPDNAIALTVLGGHFEGNGDQGIAANGARYALVQGAVCRGNGSHGIELIETKDASISGCDLRDNNGWGLYMDNGAKSTDRISTVGNVIKGNGAGAITSLGSGSKVLANTTDQVSTLSSASTIAVPEGCDTVLITGSTNIGSVKASFDGRRIVLRFAQALTVVSGNNLKLRGNFNATSLDTLTLVCMGGNWYEVARSAN